jgi:hypothetical protein
MLRGLDAKARKLVGPRKNVYRGTEFDLVEGPHLYKGDGWYCLLTAEGGTAYDHACTLPTWLGVGTMRISVIVFLLERQIIAQKAGFKSMVLDIREFGRRF